MRHLFFLLTTIRGGIVAGLYGLNLAVFSSLLTIIALIYLVAYPLKNLRHPIFYLMNLCPDAWAKTNNLIIVLSTKTRWKIEGLEQLSKQDWYLLLSNHISWLDIFVLFRVFSTSAPPLRFFMKRQLLWVPFLGWSAWLLGHPFMHRYSKSFLSKYPDKKGLDLKTTQHACQRFKNTPITIINFVEGTRFTLKKRQLKQSPYSHLLPPKAGGVAFVLQAMQSILRNIIDVTIVYPGKPITFWRFCCGDVEEIAVIIKVLPITPDLIGDYYNDRDFRIRFQTWLNQVWQQKEMRIQNLLENTTHV